MYPRITQTVVDKQLQHINSHHLAIKHFTTRKPFILLLQTVKTAAQSKPIPSALAYIAISFQTTSECGHSADQVIQQISSSNRYT